MSSTPTDGPDWRPVRRVRAHEEVLARIEEQIAAGRLKAGDRLPGERQLAESLGVSRASVREALRVLEAMGVLVSTTGRGPDAGAVLTARPADALADVLRLQLGLAAFSLHDIVETRRVIETWAARSAAAQATPEDVERLRDAVSRMAGPDLTPDRFNQADADFHLALAEASGNTLIATLMHGLRDAVGRHAVEAVERLGWPESAELLRTDHHRIVEAVAAGRADKAAQAVDEHLRRSYPDL
ncbi:FadR/GntR family transcriptional regulator [Yinghuangia seranimata]|uniref:FadR/GntR family transcriptional regulator n=1 Tax=Yinghuangia seranimata TaxID=408067 RepID=UPI00248B6B0C|nr:FadR/GntR family transcriptional regulator [Yinghuangia seranimata]MDI2129473.1 FadR/GntR family transcriptional regulator [Yinghuangia seranimata]